MSCEWENNPVDICRNVRGHPDAHFLQPATKQLNFKKRRLSAADQGRVCRAEGECDLSTLHFQLCQADLFTHTHCLATGPYKPSC